MLDLANFFSKPSKLPLKDIQKKKTGLSSLISYYNSKINFLSQRNLDPYLMALACRDAPLSRPSRDSSSLEQRKFLKNCLRYYRKKLQEKERELKKVNSYQFF